MTKKAEPQYQILSGFHQEVGEPVPPTNKRRKHFFQPGDEEKLVAEVGPKRLGELVESGVVRKLATPAARSNTTGGSTSSAGGGSSAA